MYWWPPSVKAFDPLARPLGGSPAESIDQVNALMQPEVLAALGVNALLDQKAIEWLGRGGRLWVPDMLDVPLLLAMMPSELVKGRGLLLAYSLLYETRPPPGAYGTLSTNERLKGPFSPEIVFTRYFYGDLPDGGLPPDVMTTPQPDKAGGAVVAGAIIENYWDLSDSNWPRRKCVTHWPKSALVGSGDEDQAKHHRPYASDGGTAQRVMQWNHDDQKWEQEGGDFNREIVSSEAEIFSTVLMVVKMVLSCIPIYGGVFGSMMQLVQDGWALELRHIRPGSGPITPDEVFSSLGADFIGLVGSFGGSVVGLTPDGKPITTGDVLAHAASDTFMGTMASVQALPVIGVAANVTMDVITQAGKYSAGLIEIGKRYGIGNIKVDVADVKKYAVALVAGGQPTPVTVQTKIAADVGTPPSPAEMDPGTYQRQAWDGACVAYALLGPVDQLRFRRNVVLGYRNTLGGNSATIVTPGEEGGIGAHGVEELDETALDVGMAFDQYLSQMHANEFVGGALDTLNLKSMAFWGAAGSGRFAEEALASYVAQLKIRYHLT